MTPTKLRSMILANLEKRHDIKKQYGSWVTISCVFCGDSPNPNTKHLNLKLPRDNSDNVFLIKCFQPSCDVGGILRKKHLVKLGVTDLNILNAIDNLAVKNKDRVSTVANTHHHTLPKVIDNSVAEYFNARMGIPLTADIVDKYNVFSSLIDFLMCNTDIPKTRNIEKYIKAERGGHKFIYFINHSGTMVFSRCLTKDYKGKFAIAKINPVERNAPYRFDSYTLDIHSNPYIFITESAFDSIGAELFIAKPNGISNYISLGCGSATSLKGWFRYITKHIPNAVVVFPLDSDLDEKFIRYKVIKYREYRCKNIYVVKNKLSKDFGDIREGIEPELVQIK